MEALKRHIRVISAYDKLIGDLDNEFVVTISGGVNDTDNRYRTLELEQALEAAGWKIIGWE